MENAEYPNLKNLISNNTVHLVEFHDNNFYFNIDNRYWIGKETNKIYYSDQEWPKDETISSQRKTYQFTVPLSEVAGARVLSRDNALYYMRWIRKAMQEGTLIKINE